MPVVTSWRGSRGRLGFVVAGGIGSGASIAALVLTATNLQNAPFTISSALDRWVWITTAAVLTSGAAVVVGWRFRGDRFERELLRVLAGVCVGLAVLSPLAFREIRSAGRNDADLLAACAVVAKTCPKGINERVPVLEASKVLAGEVRVTVDGPLDLRGPHYGVFIFEIEARRQDEATPLSRPRNLQYERTGARIEDESMTGDLRRATSILVVRDHVTGQIGTGWLVNGQVDAVEAFDWYVTLIDQATNTATPSIRMSRRDIYDARYRRYTSGAAWSEVVNVLRRIKSGS